MLLYKHLYQTWESPCFLRDLRTAWGTYSSSYFSALKYGLAKTHFVLNSVISFYYTINVYYTILPPGQLKFSSLRDYCFQWFCFSTSLNSNTVGLWTFSFRGKEIQTDCNTVNGQIIPFPQHRGGRGSYIDKGGIEKKSHISSAGSLISKS